MAVVRDVAAYILQKRGPMTAMKLQKLCYYAYGYHLAWESRRLFCAGFEAWANGPVCYELYDLHRGRFNLQAGEIKGDPTHLDAGERESIDLVLDTLGDYSAHELSTMTHRELPWIKARERSGAMPLERSNEPLDDVEIAEYFEALVTAVPDGQEQA